MKRDEEAKRRAMRPKEDVYLLYSYRQYTQYEWRTSAQIQRDEEKAKQSKAAGKAEKKRAKEDILDMYHQYTQYEWRTIAQMKRDNEKSKKKTTKEDVYEIYSERQYTQYEVGARQLKMIHALKHSNRGSSLFPLLLSSPTAPIYDDDVIIFL
mmetsp:Transcript_18196/g.25524  ORF Transcript_18196/g.25524 Transcript_18196/m.25524 type:complete len:153 (-) Transcript_18196:530-988(-)